MSFEWHVRYPTGSKPRPKEFNGPQGRLKGLELVMASDKFKTYEFEVWIDDEYLGVATR
jgi:hypothetical protein